MNSHINTFKNGAYTVVSLNEGLNYFNISRIRTDLMAMATEVDAGMVLDLGNASNIDSSALGLFAMLYQKLDSLGRELVLVNVGEDTLDMLKLSTMDELITIRGCLEEIA